ncbi:MAG TPA: serine hydrolase [Vicinamibacterales bacterium]|nr:serine hydrolase [Vicinamibacterales bacterium]
MRHRHLSIVSILAALLVVDATASAQTYFPDRFSWETRRPEASGFNAAALEDAIKFAIANENPNTKELAVDIATTFSREPHNAIIGPVKARGALNGLIVHRGYIVAEWGETSRVDMTFSVTKSFLSTVVGLAWQRGLIRDVTDRVGPYVPDSGLFDAPHNQPITWEHLLRQTSDWQGTLWGKPDWADRPEGERPADYPNRKLSEPGTRYKYNDVRVNVLALAALHVWRRPLPQVLRDEVMEPIGASNTWRWHGYENSWIELDGARVQSMTGGGHWGGGMFISARDMARFGLLFLRHGRWKDREIVSPKWIEMARTPGPANAEYGYMNWFLNTGRKPLPSAPESSVTFRGNGANIIYIDWENDLLVVVRWIRGGNALDQFIGKILGAMAKPTQND